MRQIWIVFLLCAVFGQPAGAADAELISIKTPRGVTQKFIFIKRDKPVASVILFAGGKGALGLRSASEMGWGDANFLVRTRDMFAAGNLNVAVIDAPSGQQSGMNAVFRISKDHAEDIGAVAAYLKKQAVAPVWLVGTSMGTFSAANGAIGAKDVDGLVLTSTITRSRPEWKIAGSHGDGVASMAVRKIAVPVLIVAHKEDGCEITPASGAAKLKARLTGAPKVEVVILDGGSPPQSEPCKAKSQHGFFGIEREAVQAITHFIAANSR